MPIKKQFHGANIMNVTCCDCSVVLVCVCVCVCVSSIDFIDEGNVITGCSLLLKKYLFTVCMKGLPLSLTGYQNECQLNQAVLRVLVIALVRDFEIFSLASCYREVI